MDIQLKNLRKRAGYKQNEFAEIVGVPERRYASWERGEAMLNLEQAYNCAVALNCTIDEIAGREPASPALSQDEHALLSDYRHLTPREKGAVRATASAMADGGHAKSTETAEAV